MSSPAVAPDLADDARAHLRVLVGRDDADFREGQAEAISALVADRARALVVQRTGWGKSAVYFVATSLLRARGAGPTLIVSPLLALMRDQVAAAERAGIRARTINSANPDDWAEITAEMAADSVDVLLISPERLNNPRFRAESLPALTSGVGLLVVDEAHCVSDWGHDFRPDYRRIRDLLADLPDTTPVLATTATANERVVTDVAEQLAARTGGRAEVTTLRGPLARDSLRLGVLSLPHTESRLAWLAEHLDSLPGSGIIYCLTVAAAHETAEHLRDAGHSVVAYTGRTDPADRPPLEDRLRRNEVKALAATSALGMGFDKPDLGFVVHLGAPASPIAYYQQIGRAGRATERADVLCMPGPEDRDIWRYFASVSMPRAEQAEAVIDALASAAKPLSTPALEALVDVRRTRLELLLKVLDVDGAVERVRGGWRATGQDWTYDAERYARVAETRERESEAMATYLTTDTCRMRFLGTELDDPWATDCGRCDTCTKPWYPREVSANARKAAAALVAKAGVRIEPRAQWPTGMERRGIDVKGRIDPAERAEDGRALARLTDLGWGQRLREVLAAATVQDGDIEPDAKVTDALVRASIDVLADWDWEARPVAVTAIPSRSRPGLAVGVAERLAEVGRLEWLGPMALVHGGPIGAPGGSSAFRLAGVWERIAVDDALRASLASLDGPVLCVDDLVDSRWTMTVAARALRRAGADAVLPFALAIAG